MFTTNLRGENPKILQIDCEEIILERDVRKADINFLAHQAHKGLQPFLYHDLVLNS